MSKILKLHIFFIPCSSFSSQNSIIQWIGQILSNFLGEQIGLDMFQAISTLTKSIRVRKINRTQTFQFNYQPSYHSIPTRQEYGQNGVCTVPCPLLCSSRQLYSVVCPSPTSHYTSTFIALHIHSLVKGGGACWAYCWLFLKHTMLLRCYLWAHTPVCLWYPPCCSLGQHCFMNLSRLNPRTVSAWRIFPCCM